MKIFRLLTLLLTGVGLSACAVPDNARSGLRPVDEKNGFVTFSNGPFKTPASERIMFADPSQREEYALFKSEGRVAEVIYITTRHLHLDNLHLDSAMTTDKIVSTWNFTKNVPPSESDSFWFDAGWTGMWVKPFTKNDTQQNCAGFNAEWDRPGDDIDQLPAKIMFGYFCEAPGMALTRDDVKKRLTEVGVRGINIRLSGGGKIVDVPAIPETPTQSGLMSGVQQGPYGIPDFPYIMARTYGESKGCDQDGDC